MEILWRPGFVHETSIRAHLLKVFSRSVKARCIGPDLEEKGREFPDTGVVAGVVYAFWRVFLRAKKFEERRDEYNGACSCVQFPLPGVHL